MYDEPDYGYSDLIRQINDIADVVREVLWQIADYEEENEHHQRFKDRGPWAEETARVSEKLLPEQIEKAKARGFDAIERILYT